jgi:outer membrane protein OmpA-like peptidoglycan-associated protein
MLPSKVLRVRKQKKLPKTLSERVLDYLEKNFIVAVGAASTVFGMCVINAFFFHIEYSPTFDLHAWASMVFSATYVGIALMIMFGILLFLPTFYIGFLILGKKEVKFDENVRSKFIRRQVLFTFLFSILFALIMFALEYEWATKTTLFVVSIAIFGGLAIFMRDDEQVPIKRDNLKEQPRENVALIEDTALSDKKDLTEHKSSLKNNIDDIKKNDQFFYVLFWPRIKKTIELCFCSAYLFFKISSEATGNVGGKADIKNVVSNIVAASILVCFSGVYLVNAWFNLNPSKFHRTLACICVFLTPILAAALAGNVAYLWMRVANATKIGNFYVDEITINKHGCDVLSENGIDLCNTKIGDSYKVHDVYVMARIGSETFLKINVNGKVKQPCSSPQAAKKDNIDSSKEDVKKGTEAKEETVDETKKNLRDILMPSVDIQGLKISALPAVFSLAAINEFMKDKCSIYATAPALEKKIFSFKESDLFEFGQYVIKPERIKKFEKLAQEIDVNKTHITKIDIRGFADQIGTEQYNLNLSQLRALSVENFLRDKVSKEIDTHVFSSRGFGSTRPKKSDVDCPTTMNLTMRKACLADNRRVDVELVY